MIGNSASVTLANSGATLDLSAVHSTSGGIIQNLSGVSGTTVNLGSTGVIEVNLSTSTTFAGVIQGTGNEDLSTSALMLNGNGNTLTLDGTNTYTGGTFVIGGTHGDSPAAASPVPAKSVCSAPGVRPHSTSPAVATRPSRT